MENASSELDRARAILNTYQQVNDTPQANRILRSKLHRRNKQLETELAQLKEKYTVLQRELIHRDKKLMSIHKELFDKTNYTARLQEDFENALYHLANGKDKHADL